MSDLNDCINTLVKDAFEVEAVTYDADIEINFDTNYITIRAIDENGRTVATVSFHRYEDAPILALSKIAMGDLAELSGLPHRGRD